MSGIAAWSMPDMRRHDRWTKRADHLLLVVAKWSGYAGSSRFAQVSLWVSSWDQCRKPVEIRPHHTGEPQYLHRSRNGTYMGGHLRPGHARDASAPQMGEPHGPPTAGSGPMLILHTRDSFSLGSGQSCGSSSWDQCRRLATMTYHRLWHSQQPKLRISTVC